ncbi:SpoIIE family protein phosphatase [Cyanobacterium stanieri LEGE 03274]|uniref:SpoIIE family protein phosphatase n=1 Tax=Cyanobacterium stanieri LEGE 03274 TaxID=1828756 RepID=A0ABR9V0T1_9CHRO|nr:SpoIIE family protein phosphatase [Cyanobacterium stanieri]MBE9221184.1 SpoIIE family protein phosphatase [Cyanobacterium stanieri LEGE 03274]
MAHILIIDDDRTIQILLTRTLKKSGYEVSIASDGITGLELAEKIKPALIISDWLMPRMGGLDVCWQVKQNPALATTFFILITSKISVDDRVQGLDAGADDFICKPIDLQELKARVRAGLRLHQLSQDLQKQKQLLEQQKKLLEKQKHQLETELSEAADYVSVVLPESLRHEKINIDFRFIPSRQLGGDIFDYFFLDEENIVFYLLDVSGHGLGAALPSISTFNLLRYGNLGKVNYKEPNQVLFSLNNFFQMSNKNDKYLTIWYGIYNINSNKLTFSSAGHPPAIYVYQDNSDKFQVLKLKTPGLPIGMFPNVNYDNSSYEIESPSTLYIFSDGIYEIIGKDKQMWGIDNFSAILEKESDLDKILAQAKSHNDSDYFSDDLSIMKIEFK